MGSSMRRNKVLTVFLSTLFIIFCFGRICLAQPEPGYEFRLEFEDIGDDPSYLLVCSRGGDFFDFFVRTQDVEYYDHTNDEQIGEFEYCEGLSVCGSFSVKSGDKLNMFISSFDKPVVFVLYKPETNTFDLSEDYRFSNVSNKSVIFKIFADDGVIIIQEVTESVGLELALPLTIIAAIITFLILMLVGSSMLGEDKRTRIILLIINLIKSTNLAIGFKSFPNVFALESGFVSAVLNAFMIPITFFIYWLVLRKHKKTGVIMSYSFITSVIVTIAWWVVLFNIERIQWSLGL